MNIYYEDVNRGTVLSIVATPNQGYSFLRWSDGNTSNPRTITVNGDIDLIAIFKECVVEEDYYAFDDGETIRFDNNEEIIY